MSGTCRPTSSAASRREPLDVAVERAIFERTFCLRRSRCPACRGGTRRTYLRVCSSADAAAEDADHRHRRLLRPRRDRPARRAAEQRDELAPLHSITSSARASNDGGKVKPRALAVLRLITISYFVELLHRQIGWLRALEDTIDIARRSPGTAPPG